MKGGKKEDGRPVVMKEAFAGRRARAVGVKARKVRHLSLGEKKRIHGRAADEFLQARRITSASMMLSAWSGLHRPLADRAAFT